MTIELLLNLACLKHTGQLLPNCGDELATTWKFKLVDGKKVAVQVKPSPLYLRPSSNFSIELDIKRRLVVDTLNSLFSWKEHTETCKWRYSQITHSFSETADSILYVIGFTKKQIELMNNNKEKYGNLGGDTKCQFLLYLFQLGIPYDSDGVKGFLKLEKERYEDHPEIENFRHRKYKILETYSEYEPDYFESQHTISKKFWYGSSGGYGRDRKWMYRKSEPDSVQFRLDNPENYKQDDCLKKGKKFQLDWLNRKIARIGCCEDDNNTWSLVRDWEIRGNWNSKYGREWMDEDKLDTKTLLRVYADKRESYEKVIERIQY
jgi:hypothetical protein